MCGLTFTLSGAQLLPRNWAKVSAILVEVRHGVGFLNPIGRIRLER